MQEMPQKKALTDKEYTQLALRELIKALPLKWRIGIWLWRHQKLFWFMVRHLKVGEVITPSGKKFKGFHLKFKW